MMRQKACQVYAMKIAQVKKVSWISTMCADYIQGSTKSQELFFTHNAGTAQCLKE